MPPIIDSKVVLTLEQFAVLYHGKLLDKIIFPREFYYSHSILTSLRRMGVKVEDVGFSARLNNQIDLFNFVENYFVSKYLPYLEFRVADHCNLNCKSCGEFSGLVKKPHFPDLKRFTQDFEQLRKFIDDVGVIRILGGEPLLNPEINEYVKLTRRLYPQAQIKIVTNALLLPKMPIKFFDTLRECHASIFISFYKPLEKNLPMIQKLLADNRVPYEVNSATPMKKFWVNTTLKAHDDMRKMFLSCEVSHCLGLWEGKLSVCYKPSAINIFNKYFKQNLPTDSGLINLYAANLTTEKIKRQLHEPFELCRYCTPFAWREWGKISYPASINDWLSS